VSRYIDSRIDLIRGTSTCFGDVEDMCMHVSRSEIAGECYITTVLTHLIVDLLRYDNFVVCYTESYPQRIT